MASSVNPCSLFYKVDNPNGASLKIIQLWVGKITVGTLQLVLPWTQQLVPTIIKIVNCCHTYLSFVNLAVLFLLHLTSCSSGLLKKISSLVHCNQCNHGYNSQYPKYLITSVCSKLGNVQSSTSINTQDKYISGQYLH